MRRLTTHVLDTAQGKPAAGVRLQLYKHSDAGRVLVCERLTNGDGRCDSPLLEGAQLENALYELDFDIGSYFAAQPLPQPDSPFLEIVTLRFRVSEGSSHYHVPLVASPWSYSTYRGS